ncbi:hypothetical protein ACFO9Q_15755 [Paenibacillus sp. GCM10023252]|uniref:hypothetical protein n=1 Tax=Paenibacillus sp. GCM10023252 TaxID=3252649 RepID=UPI003614AE15
MIRYAARMLLTCMLALGFGIGAVPLMTDAAEGPIFTHKDAVPMLSELKQIGPNQLQVTYDQPVDGAKAIDPANYWIQSQTDETPIGIATLGKTDAVKPSNGLTADKVKIVPRVDSNQSFVLTFHQNMAPGGKYKLIICNVTAPGAPPSSGDNGKADFVGQ